MTETDRLTAEVERLTAENMAMKRGIGKTARWLRGDLRADTLNEAILTLNTLLPKEERISEVCWGVASLSALQAAVRNLCDIVALPESALFLTQQIKHEAPKAAKRQTLGGIRYGN